jgi:hypothetical protein
MRADTTSGTIAPQLSDHLPIYAIFHTNPPRQESNQPKSLSNQKYEKNKNTINQALRETIKHQPQELTINEKFAKLIHNLQTTIESFHEKPKTNRKHRKPWIKNSTFNLIRKQHTLHQRMLKNPTQTNKDNHKKAKKLLRDELLKSKKEYYTSEQQKAINDPKLQATILKTLLPPKQQQQ